MDINGILIINKPENITSFNVIEKIKKKFNISKISHCGTLDPMATGVLIVCFGDNIKKVFYLSGLKKRYIINILLGVKSLTLDMSGKIIFFEKKNINIDIKNIKYALYSLKKCVYQIPPLFSSIRHNKLSSYKYARLEMNINIKKRKIQIYKVKLKKKKNNQIILDIKCSKGTYVRSFVDYLESKLSIPMCITKIVRVSSGNYNILQSYALKNVLKLHDVHELKKIIYNNK